MWKVNYFNCFTIFILTQTVTAKLSNNVCKTYTGYVFLPIDNKDCYHDPDVWKNTPELLMNHVQVFETHEITTEDGYILNLFRIPHPNPRGVVVLLHPITVDGTIYVGQSNESFAYLLANNGYDVWLPNARGTYFSGKHVNLTTSNFKFWDFSFHEIGIYDYSSFFKYISNITNRNDLVVIGHSMANTATTIYASLKPDEAKQLVKVFISMSSITFLTNIRTPMKFLIPFYPLVKAILDFLKIGSLLRYTDPFYIVPIRSFTFFPFKKLAIYLISFLFGWTPNNWDPATINLASTQMTRGASWKSIYHFCQIYRNKGLFQYYDYGKKTNRLLYNSDKPPLYPLENIRVPFYMITSTDDLAGTIADSNLLYDKLPKQANIYGKHDVSGLNHVDFHYGKNRKRIVFDHILTFLDDPTKFLVNSTQA